MTGSAPGVAGAKPPHGAAPMLERALATAILRVADGMSGLGLGTGARVTRRLEGDAVFEGLDERALCMLVDPPGHDPLAPGVVSAEVLATRTGLLAFDPGLTDALIEVQTIGRVDGPARSPRRPTRIDAALSQPFARALLDQISRQLLAGSGEPRPGLLRTGSFVAGPASLGLILTAPGYLRLDLELRLGDGARAGQVSLILPMEEAVADPAAPPDAEADWTRMMREAAEGAPVRLEALLPPMRLPLWRLTSLAVGDLIPLDANALSEVTLLGGSSGVTCAGRKRLPRAAAMKARLGQLNGVRAVKIAALPGESTDRREGPSDDAGFGSGSAVLAAVNGSVETAGWLGEISAGPAPGMYPEEVGSLGASPVLAGVPGRSVAV